MEDKDSYGTVHTMVDGLATQGAWLHVDIVLS